MQLNSDRSAEGFADRRLVYSGEILIEGKRVEYGTFNAATLKKTKKRKAEPRYYRTAHFYDFVEDLIEFFVVERIVCEEASAIQRGKPAVEVSHKLRAAVEIAVVRARHTIELTYLDPPDLKFAALNKRKGTKEEMIAAAAERYGYKGDEDNEADALHLMGWALR